MKCCLNYDKTSTYSLMEQSVATICCYAEVQKWQKSTTGKEIQQRLKEIFLETRDWAFLFVVLLMFVERKKDKNGSVQSQQRSAVAINPWRNFGVGFGFKVKPIVYFDVYFRSRCRLLKQKKWKQAALMVFQVQLCGLHTLHTNASKATQICSK